MKKSILVLGLVFCLNLVHGQKMPRNKHWTKSGTSDFVFYVNNKPEAALKLTLNSSDGKALVNIGTEKYTLRKVGFWKNTLEISDENNKIIGKIYADKWFARNQIFQYNEIEYFIEVGNNPLSEVAIKHNGKLVLSYGLEPNESIKVRIRSTENSQDYLMDVILWYMFFPIATENMGDTYVFTNELVK